MRLSRKVNINISEHQKGLIHMQIQDKSRSGEGILKRHSSEIKMSLTIALAISAQVMCERALGCSGPHSQEIPLMNKGKESAIRP
jgi:hypothetical protein